MGGVIFVLGRIVDVWFGGVMWGVGDRSGRNGMGRDGLCEL